MVNEQQTAALARLAESLAEAEGSFSGTYAIPCRWLDRQQSGIKEINPAAAYGQVLAAIRAQEPEPLAPAVGQAGWTSTAVVYNLFPRLALAWDHNGDGQVGGDPLAGGWRETGTLVKALALLPYIRSLGCNTIHLLPVAAIGSDGGKGDLGSPYAVRNPYRIDESLAEPALGLTAEECMAAFVAAAHRSGIRVVVEFVFRTASPDSDWVKERPDWFYWLGADVADRPAGSRDASLYGPPIFGKEELQQIHALVDEQGTLENLPAPAADFKSLFSPPPPAESVVKEDGRWIGTNAKGRKLRVATAFADWPPDDCQPPWTDVAYLKLYQDPDFEYVAYNTIRMYDADLALPAKAVTDLWDRIVGILPWWQKQFGIDGVMIDMGHSLPSPLKDRLIAAARENDVDFAFWDEKFPVNKESVEEGYNGVIGYSWQSTCRPQELESLLGRCCGEGYALPFFATAESHNSPRAAAREGGVIHSQGAFPFLCALPAMVWIHNGFELGEKAPVNTGLDFTAAEAASFPAEELPLFSRGKMDWAADLQLLPWVEKCLQLRQRFATQILATDTETARLWRADNEMVMVFCRVVEGKGFALVGNIDWQKPQTFSTGLPDGEKSFTCLLSDRTLTMNTDDRLTGELEPGEVLWFEISGE